MQIHFFFTNTKSVHCQTLQGTSFLIYLTCKNGLRMYFRFSCTKHTISCLVKHFHGTGSMQDRKQSGWASVPCDDNVDNTHHTLLLSPRRSLRNLSYESGLSYKHVKTYTHCICIMHKIKDSGIFLRLKFLKEYEKKYYESNVIRTGLHS